MNASREENTLAASVAWRATGGLALLLGILVLLAGCARSAYEANHTNLAQGYLPSERTVPHHPDSLNHLDIIEQDQTFEFELDKSYESLWREWSSTLRAETGRTQRARGLEFQSFATLWSLDLSLAALEVELGIQGLSKDLARDYIEDRKRNQKEFLQIDVYSYADAEQSSDTWLNTPGRRVTLRDDAGNEYRPDSTETSIPREAHGTGETAIYRRNSFIFNRVDEEGNDILKDVQTLRLRVQVTGNDNYYFSWSFDDLSSISSR